VSRPISSPLRAVLSLALGALIALPSAPAFAVTLAPSGRERSEALLAEGDADSAKGEWEEAISKYRASYYGLTRADQASYLGSLPVRKAMRAYGERIAQSQDPVKRRALLQRQRVLLDEFLDAVATKPGAAEEVGEDVIAELEATRSSIDAALEPPSKVPEPTPAEPPHEPSTSSDPPPPQLEQSSADTSSTSIDTPKPPRDWVGLGLVIGGSVALGTGLGVFMGRWTILDDAHAKVDSGGDPYGPGTDLRASYLAEEEARAQKFLIAGSVVAGVGLATAIGGAVRLLVHRHRSTRATALHVAPLLAPTTAGVVFHRRF